MVSFSNFGQDIFCPCLKHFFPMPTQLFTDAYAIFYRCLLIYYRNC